MKPFPDPEDFSKETINYCADKELPNTVNANTLVGAIKYTGLNNVRYF
jgi:hypothetical protein